jgi:serine/threonine-protein kinase
MGVVYQARQRGLNRLVALKMILAGARAGAQELARFRMEAEAVARLRCPHIVQVYEVGEQDGLPFFSLEYVEGGTLDQKLNGTPLPPRQAAELVATLADAVDVAHRQGIVHRDLKPANILLQRKSEIPNPKSEKESESVSDGGFRISDFEPKITDFGLAKRLNTPDGQTPSGAILGTPSYMAPEQAGRHSSDIGPAADLYALGATLYEALTGRPPFKAATPLDTVLQVIAEEPVAPSRLQPKLPRDLETVCLTCLQKEPRKRYPSAGALAADLRRFLANEPINARPTSLWERTWKWARRRPAIAALVGVSAVAAGALFAVILIANVRLQAERDYAREQERTAMLQRDKAAAARAEAEKQFQRAEANFRRARAAVDQVTEVAEKELAGVPQMDPVRRRLLEQALRLYKEFAQQKGNDPAVRQEVARAYQRVGEIQGSLGLFAAADQALRRSIRLLERLTAEFPSQLDYREDLAAALHTRATALRLVMRLPESEALFRRAIKVKMQLVAAYPNNPGFRHNLAGAYNNLGIVLNALGRDEKAERALTRALDISEKLMADSPHDPEFQSSLAMTHHCLGVVWDRRGEYAKAEKAFRRALALQAALADRFPDVHEYRQETGKHWNSLGIVLTEAGRWAEAENALLQAVSCKEKVAADFPQVVDYQLNLANSYHMLANLYGYRDQPAKAEGAFRKAIVIQEKLVEKHPESPDFAIGLGGTYCDQGTRQADGKKFLDAIKWYDRAVQTLEAVRRKEPRHETARRFLGNAYQGRAAVLLIMKRTDEAHQDQKRAAEMLQKQ